MVLNCEVFGSVKVFDTKNSSAFLTPLCVRVAVFCLSVNNIVNVVFLVIFLHILLCVKLLQNANS